MKSTRSLHTVMSRRAGMAVTADSKFVLNVLYARETLLSGSKLARRLDLLLFTVLLISRVSGFEECC